METPIQEILEEILKKINTPFRRIRIEKKDNDTYRANIESEEPSLLIGHHGENIHALQTILKTIFWKKFPENECNIVLDVDDYRKRQEENVIKLAERKAESVRKTSNVQSLPPMSAYFRRLIHMHLAANFKDIETESLGEGDFRYLTIKLKTPVTQ